MLGGGVAKRSTPEGTLSTRLTSRASTVALLLMVMVMVVVSPGAMVVGEKSFTTCKLACAESANSNSPSPRASRPKLTLPKPLVAMA